MGSDHRHEPKGEQEPLRWGEEGHGEAHGRGLASHSFELMCQRAKTGGFMLERSVHEPWPSPSSVSRTFRSDEA